MTTDTTDERTGKSQRQRNWALLVKKNDLSVCQVLEKPAASTDDIADGNIVVDVERFSFTANNVLYAVLGDSNHYWDLFPTRADYGIIPVWGYGIVSRSAHSAITVGERLFGIFPMATQIEMKVADVGVRRFRDASPHRERPNPVYSSYVRVGVDTNYTGASGDTGALFRPIFMVSFMAETYFSENKFFGSDSVVVSSASSKTAAAFAYLVHTRAPSIKVIGLTSKGNADFVKSLGYYDQTMLYDDVASLPGSEKIVFFDVAGSWNIRAAVHRRYGENVKHSARVGMAHWVAPPTVSQMVDADRKDAELPGSTPQLFFAPPYMEIYARAPYAHSAT